jgi:hypothetical protein
MKVLIACEESQAVCIEFREKGFEAYSCDIQDCSGNNPEWHIKQDIFHLLSSSFSPFWHFMGGHPECKYLTNSGVRWLASKNPKQGYEWSEKYSIYINWDRYEKMKDGALFFKCLYSNLQTIGHGYLENPIMNKYAMEIIGIKYTQIIQPYMFGHGEKKATCLWLVGLPKLKPTNIVEGREQNIWKMPPSKDRSKLRSKTYPGIAQAMANQWGDYLLNILE